MKVRYPHLAHAARTLLATRATSAASGRVFSSTGFIASSTRSALAVDSLEHCALVKSALKYGVVSWRPVLGSDCGDQVTLRPRSGACCMLHVSCMLDDTMVANFTPENKTVDYLQQ
jgi:hypothetical protein